jgi:hypothetical protein
MGSTTYEQTVNDTTSEVKFSNMNLALGLGLNYKVSENCPASDGNGLFLDLS